MPRKVHKNAFITHRNMLQMGVSGVGNLKLSLCYRNEENK